MLLDPKQIKKLSKHIEDIFFNFYILGKTFTISQVLDAATDFPFGMNKVSQVQELDKNIDCCK